MIKAVHPYLNFPGTTEEAFNFYQSVLGGELTAISRFRDFADNGMGVPEEELDRVANMGLRLTPEVTLMGTDTITGWRPLQVGNHSYILLEADSAEEAERMFRGLAEGGAIEMDLQQTEWARLYGSLADRYGVQWMVMME